jgi:uncharacterized protein YcgL (UPF0745 family)
MSTLYQSQIHYENIDKYEYEEFSKASLWQFFAYEDEALTALEQLYRYSDEHQYKPGYYNGLKSIFPSLNSHEVAEYLKENTDNKVDQLSGYVELFEYSKEDLNILDTLSGKGFALILIPALNYQEVKNDLKKQGFFVNAIFSPDDSRESTNLKDLSRVIPVHCKYLGLAVSRKEFDYLYVHTEDTFDRNINPLEDSIHGIKLTDKKNIFKKILSSSGAYIKDESFINLDHFYKTSKINYEMDKYQDFQEYRLGDIAVPVNSFYWTLPKLLIVLENYTPEKKGRCLKYVTELMDSVKNSTDIESEYFNLDQAEMESYGELQAALTQLWSQLIALDSLKVPEYFDQFSTWVGINSYSYKYKPNEINIQMYKSENRSEFDGEIMWSDDCDHCSKTVSINQSIVLVEYLELYLSTELGKSYVDLSALEASKGTLDSAWKNIKVLAPSIGDQRLVVSALNKFNKLRSELDAHKDDLIGDPFNAGRINLDLDGWLSRLGKLSTSEDSLHLIKKGESDTVEFKETLSFHIMAERQNKNTRDTLESVIAKVIVGFLNKRGGTLFIGVSDDGTIVGLDRDLEHFYQNNLDRILLKLREVLENKIGNEYLSFWKYEVVNINSKDIIRIDCIPSLLACFLNSKHFLVRTNPATVELHGTEMMDYIKTRFGE